MWELDHKQSWALKNSCFWTVVLEMTLESPLDCKEIQPVHPKGNQSWIFIGRIDAEAEIPVLWPPGVKNWLIGKDPDAAKDWKLSMLQSMWLQRVRHDWVTELNWTELRSLQSIRVIYTSWWSGAALFDCLSPNIWLSVIRWSIWSELNVTYFPDSVLKVLFP